MKPIDLTGEKFGRLTAITRIAARYEHTKYVCQCECGRQCTVFQTHLARGNTRSCGCLNSDVTTKRNVENARHGMWQTNEFHIWQGMLQRCSPSNIDEEKRRNYSDRGITVCDRWASSFEAFFQDMGKRPSKKHSLDRINNDLGYEPGNVRWATIDVQANNRRNSVRIDWDGKTLSIKEFARLHGLNASCVSQRLRKGITGGQLAAPAGAGLRGRHVSEKTRLLIAEARRKWWAEKKTGVIP